MPTKINPFAGKLAPQSSLVNVAKLVTTYYSDEPDPSVRAQRVAFGTSGHRGSAFEHSFNESHVLAITQAICQHRKANNTKGPLFLGIELDHPRNEANANLISADAARVKVRVMRTNEEIVIARSVCRILELDVGEAQTES